jgi:hypothetical protein
MVSEDYSDADRAAFVANLDAIDPSPAGLDAIESCSNRRAEPARTYWRLKRLVVRGYFTSERVMKDVLAKQVVPGTFDGSAPMTFVPTAAETTDRG